tara:strand:- start:144 stop:257 length:114 start_codon:yes stop_codon:yes gene_type:complete
VVAVVLMEDPQQVEQLELEVLELVEMVVQEELLEEME